MHYDFTTVIDRSRLSASKWNVMKQANPCVPKGIVPLSVADMELKNPPEIAEGLKDFLNEAILGYTDPSKEYLAAVCSWMQRRHGWKAAPEWIVPTPGVVPALFCAVRAFTKPGDGVILLTPVYYPFYRAVEKSGRSVAECPLAEDGGRYKIDFNALEALAQKPENTMLLFCSPHNPVGRVWSEAELQAVAEICLRHHVLVVSDEIHSDLILPGNRHTVFASISPKAEQNCIVCTAPSKTFNLAGLQTSNIFIPNEELRHRFFEEMRRVSLPMPGILGCKACEIAYTRCGAWLDELLCLLDSNRCVTEKFLNENIPQIKPSPLEGTYLQWWDCRSLGLSPKDLEHFMTHEALIFPDDGALFGKNGAGYERINLACPTKVLQAALERLLHAVRSLKSHKN